MKQKPVLWGAILLLIAAAVVIYFFFVRSAQNTTPLQAQKGQIVVNLTELNDSGESGTAVLEEKDGKVVVTIQAVGGTNEAQPAHIHANDCPGLGPVKHGLKNVVNGTSATTLDVSLAQLKEQLPLALNIHESANNFKSYVSCGEISLP